jgi:hypothetical protein
MIPIICIIFLGHSNMTGYCQPKPVTPIIRKLGPNYAALNAAYHAAYVRDSLPKLFRSIELIKRLPNVKFGGIVAMYGWSEGGNLECATNFTDDFSRLIGDIRNAIGNDALPVVLNQPDDNAIQEQSYAAYYKYSDIVAEQIRAMKGVHLCPTAPMAKEFYCMDHHYNKQGYDIFASDAVRILK